MNLSYSLVFSILHIYCSLLLSYWIYFCFTCCTINRISSSITKVGLFIPRIIQIFLSIVNTII